MAFELWTSFDLYQVLQDDRLDPIPSYFLDTFFPTPYFSEDKEIIFSKLPTAGRKLAPFVLPTAQGKPIFGRKAETLKSFSPPYIKPKDVVRPTEARTRNPSEILRQGPLTLEQRFDNRVLEVMAFHQRAIKMQTAWMAARAFIDGKLLVSYDSDTGGSPIQVLIDFGRAAGNTIILNTNYWDDPDHDILGDVEDYMDQMYLAPFGGTAAQMIVGSEVAVCLKKNKAIRELMNKFFRGSDDVNIPQGMLRTVRPMNFLGNLDAGLAVWTYKDIVQNDDESYVDIMSPKDIVLVAPGADGICAYGAIYDVDAMQTGQALATDIFPKMFKTDDPGELYIMNQSAPLPIPLYPNRTLKATVLL